MGEAWDRTTGWNTSVAEKEARGVRGTCNLHEEKITKQQENKQDAHRQIGPPDERCQVTWGRCLDPSKSANAAPPGPSTWAVRRCEAR